MAVLPEDMTESGHHMNIRNTVGEVNYQIVLTGIEDAVYLARGYGRNQSPYYDEIEDLEHHVIEMSIKGHEDIHTFPALIIS